MVKLFMSKKDSKMLSVYLISPKHIHLLTMLLASLHNNNFKSQFKYSKIFELRFKV